MQLRIDGTHTSGPLIIQMSLPPIIPGYKPFFVVTAKDLGVANTGKPISKEAPRGSHTGYYTSRTDLFNPISGSLTTEEGTGLIADAWNDDPVYSYRDGLEAEFMHRAPGARSATVATSRGSGCKRFYG